MGISRIDARRALLRTHSWPLHRRYDFIPLYDNRRRALLQHSPKLHTFPRISSKAVEFETPNELQLQEKTALKDSNSIVLLDAPEMMCGECVTRVKSIVSTDEHVDSTVVNMLTETAAIKLKEGAGLDFSAVADELAEKVSASVYNMCIKGYSVDR